MKLWALPPALDKEGVVVHACDSSTGDREAQVPSEDSWDYEGPLKTNKHCEAIILLSTGMLRLTQTREHYTAMKRPRLPNHFCSSYNMHEPQ